MKNTNYILKVMENLQTNVAILTVVNYAISGIDNTTYEKLSEEMHEHGFRQPCISLHSYIRESEEMYNYLEQLLLNIEKPF